MEVEEMSAFFDDYAKIPEEEKHNAVRYLIGVSAVMSDRSKVAAFVDTDKDFDTVFAEVVESIRNDGTIDGKEHILKGLDDRKELLSKMHRSLSYKRLMSSLSNPLDVYGQALGSNERMFFTLLMSMLMMPPPPQDCCASVPAAE